MAGVYKRGKTWWGRAQRGNREHRRSLKTTDKGIAEKRLRQWLEELEAVAWGDRPSRTFTQASERFIKEHMPVLKPKAAQRYGVSILHLIEHMGNLPIASIGSAEMTEFETARRTAGAAAPTIRRDLACLSSILGCCVDWEWIEVNPVPAQMRRRRRKGLKESPGRTRYLSHEEEASLLAAATPDVRRAIDFALATGLRLEEQFSLTWAKIDQSRKRIILGKETKAGVPREIPIEDRAAQILAQMPRHIKCPYVFWHDDGDERGATRYNNMTKGLAGAVRRAGLKDLCWHDLRRTYGCRKINDENLRMEQVQQLLGHHSVTVTEKSYAFLSMDRIQEVLTKPGTGAADSKTKRKGNQ